MFTHSALRAVLLLASAAAIAHAASKYSYQKETCHNQPCLPPNRCKKVDGLSVCVRSDAHKCSDVKCDTKAGFECVLMQDDCKSLPCHPKAYCVKSNPCGRKCKSPDYFCQLFVANVLQPTCRPVVEPTCQNKPCPAGKRCSPVHDNICVSPPCQPKLLCLEESLSHQWDQVYGLSGRGSSSSSARTRAEELRARILSSGDAGSDKNSSSTIEDDD